MAGTVGHAAPAGQKGWHTSGPDPVPGALGEPLSSLGFIGRPDRLQLTGNTKPAILAAPLPLCRPVESPGVRARCAGHSLEEHAAHVAAGTLSFADALQTVRRRWRYMQEAVPRLQL